TATATRNLCLGILRLLSTLVDGAGRSWAGWLRLYVPTSQCFFAARARCRGSPRSDRENERTAARHRHRGGSTAPGRCPPTKREDDCGSELGPKCRQPAVRNLVDPLRASGYMRVSARIPPALWGRSSVGRALEWHSRGRGFDSLRLHLPFNMLHSSNSATDADCRCSVGFLVLPGSQRDDARALAL